MTPRPMPPRRPVVRMVLGRALGRRCPSCGARGAWKSWLTMRERCPSCGVRLDRGEPDAFLGAYLVNLVVAELAVAILCLVLLIVTWPDTPWTVMMYGAAVMAVAAPIVFYPMTRTAWIAIDMVIRPVTDEERAGLGVRD
jgi:uncharacterized protein (DUF983 family)